KPAGDRILERLTAAQPVQASPEPAAKAAEPVDERKLEALTQAKDSAEPAQKPQVAEKPADPEKANEKLSSLLGGPK
ncbi:MAG TPA: ABC transporter ATP-binding protein, partial [Verrucomicrobiae bacterium]|nr:ABC transporter ATP-binding protein [Verrucomicrobiae bacterium]